MLAPRKLGSVGISDIEQVFLKGRSELGERILRSHIRREGIDMLRMASTCWYDVRVNISIGLLLRIRYVF